MAGTKGKRICLLTFAWGSQWTARDRKTNCWYLFPVWFSGRLLGVPWMTQHTGHHQPGQQLLSHVFDLHHFPPLMSFCELAFGLETSRPHIHISWLVLSSRFPASYFSLHLRETLDNGATPRWRKDPWVTVKNIPKKSSHRKLYYGLWVLSLPCKNFRLLLLNSAVWYTWSTGMWTYLVYATTFQKP